MKWLFALIFLFSIANADEITTGNLITNGNFETGNSNGWNTSGDVMVLNDCCELNNVESNYDLEFGDSGSINQDFNLYSDTITQNMLDNGITLNSTIEAQNGECSVVGCWGGQGEADTFTNQLTIKDSDGNILASNTNIRTDVTGIEGANFSDILIYNGTGSSVGNIDISGTDANAPARLGGANIDNISVTMTYDNSVLDNEVVKEIGDIFEDLEDVFEYIEFVQIEELFEEFIPEFTEPPMEEEIYFEPEEVVEQKTILTLLPPPSREEEIIEETEEIITSFLPPPSEKEEAIEEEIVEEEPKETVTESNEKEEVKEEKPTSETTKTAKVKNANTTKQKNIQSKETIKANLVKIMDKVDKDIKDISKNLQIKNIIKLDAMASDQASLDIYNVPFYKSENIYLDQLQIQDLRQLYTKTTLASYTSTDPITLVREKLNKINIKKNKILIELEQLKNG